VNTRSEVRQPRSRAKLFRRTSAVGAVAALAVSALTVPPALAVPPSVTVVAGGLDNPRGMRRSDLLSALRQALPQLSDNTLIHKMLGWEPDTKLRVGMEKTYRWIYDQMAGKK